MQQIPATYVDEVYLGLTTSHLVRLPNGIEMSVRQISEAANAISFTPGEEVTVGWKPGDARLHTG